MRLQRGDSDAALPSRAAAPGRQNPFKARIPSKLGVPWDSAEPGIPHLPTQPQLREDRDGHLGGLGWKAESRKCATNAKCSDGLNVYVTTVHSLASHISVSVETRLSCFTRFCLF